MLAINAKFYRNTGTWGTPVWAVVNELEAVNVDPRYTEGPSNSRDSSFERISVTMASCPVTARIKSKPGNANYEAIMDAFAFKTPLDLLILDAAQDTPGARGVRGEFFVVAAGDDQAMTNRNYRALEFKLADTDNPPAWAKVTNGEDPELQFAQPGGTFA